MRRKKKKNEKVDLTVLYDPTWGTKTIALLSFNIYEELMTCIITPGCWEKADETLKGLDTIIKGKGKSNGSK